MGPPLATPLFSVCSSGGNSRTSETNCASFSVPHCRTSCNWCRVSWPRRMKTVAPFDRQQLYRRLSWRLVSLHTLFHNRTSLSCVNEQRGDGCSFMRVCHALRRGSCNRLRESWLPRQGSCVSSSKPRVTRSASWRSVPSCLCWV